MAARTAEAVWNGDLAEGKGHIALGSGAFEGDYDWRSRSGDGALTNPEELIAAAHAGCFSMAFAHALTQGGFTVESIHTTAKVHLEKTDTGFEIPRIDLITKATVPGADAESFQRIAADAKANCPVSKVLAGAEITLDATLL